MTGDWLARIFDRKPAIVQDVLCELKKEGCRSTDYWLNYDSNIVVISDRKKEILDMISQKPRRMA